MATIPQQVAALATRIGTEFKTVRAEIVALVGSKASLTTTDKSTIVAAINEVKASATGAPPDATTAVKGVVLLASDTDATTGTDTTKALTPSNVAAVFTNRIATSTALGTSNTLVPSQNAVKAYADALIGANDAMVFKGVIDASANPNYPASNRGDTYRVSVGGKIGGASGDVVENGDLLIAMTDGTAAGTKAAVGAQWEIVQANLDGAVVGPASSVSGNLPTYSGTTGKVIADSGFAVSTGAIDTSAVLVPTRSAVKTYVDAQVATKQASDAELTAIAGLVSAADTVPYFTGSGTAALATFTAAGRSLVGGADAAAQRATLSVYSQAEIGDPNTDYITTFNNALV